MTECRRAWPRSGRGMRVPKAPIAPKGWAGSSPAGAIGTVGANGTGTESTREAGVPDAAAFYRQAANAALVALAALDPAHERAEVSAALAVGARGAFGPSNTPERHRKARAGLLSGFAAHARPSGEGAPS